MRLEKSFLILETMLKGVKNNLKNKIKNNFIIISLILLFFIILGAILSYRMFSPMISAIITGNKGLFFSFILSSMLNVSLITFVIYIILMNSNNESSNYSKIIKWLPLTKQEKICAQMLQELFFILITNISYIIFFHIPAFVGSKVSIYIIMIYLLSVILQSLVTYFLLSAFYLSLIRLLYLITHKKIIKELALIILSISFFIYIIGKINLESILIKGEEYKLSLESILLPIIDLFMGYKYFDTGSIIICLVSSCIILILGILITFLFGGIELDNRNLMLFKYIPKSRSKLFWIIIKEVKQMLRSEVNISNFFVLLCTILSIRFLDSSSISSPLVNLVLSSFCSVFALNSFGEDINFSIYSNIVPISNKLISYGKLIGNLIVGVLIYAILYFMVFTDLGLDLELFKNGLLYTIVGVIVIYAYGILVPIRETEPFSNILVFLSFLVICILISVVSMAFNGLYIYEFIIISVILTILLIPKLYKLKSLVD